MDKQNERIRIKDIAQQAGVSVGTVDRVLHGRTGVSESSRIKVENVLQQLDYQPNMYASALASNKKYKFACLIPTHGDGDYWESVERGMGQAIRTFSDFHLSLKTFYYDQYEEGAFVERGKQLLGEEPDGVVLSPTIEKETVGIVAQLQARGVPYVFIDSNLPQLHPLTFYGQHAGRSGYFAARMLKLLAQGSREIVIFRSLYEGKLASNQQQRREEGFYDFMQAHCPELKIWELDFYAKQPEENDFLLDRFFFRHPEVTCGITFNSKAYIVGEYMQRHHRNDFGLVGYDLLKRNVACLRQGTIDFIIAQQPTVQGYDSIESLCNHLILKKKIKACHYMPITLLTVDNIDFYLDAHVEE